MPLSAPAEREPIHTRTIECRGYLRGDGLWDIEGRLADTKTYAFDNRWRGEVAAGQPVHDMRVRLTVDDDLVIRAVEAVIEAAPFAVCAEVTETTPVFAVLEGERIGPGWSRTVCRLVGGTKGCTHVSELLGRMATTCYQTVFPYRARTGAPPNEPRDRPPRLVNSCHAWRDDGALVAEHYPRYVAKERETAGE
jgi:hypothetical protein